MVSVLFLRFLKVTFVNLHLTTESVRLTAYSLCGIYIKPCELSAIISFFLSFNTTPTQHQLISLQNEQVFKLSILAVQNKRLRVRRVTILITLLITVLLMMSTRYNQGNLFKKEEDYTEK